MTLEKLEEIREKIAALDIDVTEYNFSTYSFGHEDGTNEALGVFDAAIAEERAKPEPLKCNNCEN